MVSFFIVLITLFFFCSCTNTTEEAVGQKSRVTVDFSTFQVEVEDMSRSSRAALSTAATRLSFAVFKEDGVTLVNETTIHQERTSSGTGFGSVEVELYPGNYKMVVVAHSGSDNAEIESATSVILPGKTYTDTFTKVADFTVFADQNINLSKTLGRITSAFVLVLNDTPPSNASRMEVVLFNGSSAPTQLNINPSTGLAENNWSQTRNFTMEEITDETPDLVYYIGNRSLLYATVKATAYDSGDVEIVRHVMQNVPLASNQQTVATGTFFQSSAFGTFTVGDWGTNNNIEY